MSESRRGSHTRWSELADGSTATDRIERRRAADGARALRPDRSDLHVDRASQPATTPTFRVRVARTAASSEPRGWKTNRDGMDAADGCGPRHRRSADDLATSAISMTSLPCRSTTSGLTRSAAGFATRRSTSFRRTTKVIERCLLMTTDPGDLVLDPTCGSGTTAYVAEQWGRRWITIDTSRVALALARSRLMAAKYPYYLLADSEAGIRKEAELTGQTPPRRSPPTTQRRPTRLRLRARAARDPQVDRPEPRHPRGHDARGDRRRHRPPRRDRDALRPPYEDSKIVRVSGPFTVESLSPHRVLATGPRTTPPSRPPSTTDAGPVRDQHPRQPAPGRRPEHQARRAPRVHPPRPVPGRLRPGARRVHRERRTRRRSRSRSGPSSARSARSSSATPPRRRSRSPTCSSSAASPSTRWQARRRATLGRLTILQARMNPDLAMGDELLKKTGAGNLFMVFGEPDIEVRGRGRRPARRSRSAAWTSTTRPPAPSAHRPSTTSPPGSSTPTTTATPSSSATPTSPAPTTLRQAPPRPQGRHLRRSLGDRQLDRLSRPFPRPTTGKIAVKVINHYGDEVMKVFAA